MRIEDFSDTERAVVEAFKSGTAEDVGQRPDPVVRSEVIRFLLLGGVAAEPGNLAALWLTGAQITGPLEVEYADISVPIDLHDCRFDGRLSLFNSRLKRLSLERSTMPGFWAGMASFDGTVNLTEFHSTGDVEMVGTRIAGALILRRAELTGSNIAFHGVSLSIGTDLLAEGLACRGELRLDNAEVTGSLRFQGATVDNPGGVALSALDLRVGANADFCDGFAADGTVRLSAATITSRLSFERATLTGPTGTALDCRHLTTRELVLLPSAPPDGIVDLDHARLGLLHDAPATWPSALHLDGLTYQALSDPDGRTDRLRWLRLDPRGYRPSAYTQLAQVYRAAGRDNDARTVLLAGERHRREALSRPGRWWGHLQDLTVGYGYRPLRAAGWLIALVLLGTAVFARYPPRPTGSGDGPQFAPFVYSLDLLLPVGDLGQQAAFHPDGASAWLAYTLTLAGLVLVSTIAAAGARTLRRN